MTGISGFLKIVLLFSSALLISTNAFARMEESQSAAESSVNTESILPDELSMYLRSFSHEKGIDVSLGAVPVERLGQVGFGLPEIAQEILTGGPTKLQVVVFVPKNLEANIQDEYLRLLKERIQEAYPRAEISLQPSFLDPAEGQNAMEADNTEIRANLIDSQDRDPIVTEQKKNIGRLMIAMNRAKYMMNFAITKQNILDSIQGLKIVRLAKSFKSNNPRVRDMTIATSFGMGKAGINAVAWIATSTSRGVAAWMSALSSVALDVFFARYANDWNTWKRQSTLTWNRFGFGKLAAIINKSEARRAWLVDQLNGLLWTVYFRTLALVDNPNVNPAFSIGAIHDLWGPYLFGLGIGGPIAAASNVATNQLRQKGKLSTTSQFYTSLGFDASFTASGFLMQKGWVASWWALSILEWSARLGFIAKNIITPAQYQKIVLVDPRVSEEDIAGILHREGLEFPAREASVALPDWKLQVTSANSPQSRGLMAKFINGYENFVRKTYQGFVIAHDRWTDYKTNTKLALQCRHLLSN